MKSPVPSVTPFRPAMNYTKHETPRAEKRNLATMMLLIASISFSLIAAEITLRLAFEPVDYLMPLLIPDNILRHKVSPYSAGHDAWGFRNKSVPDTADIVAIGDSLTYGVSATAANSWPATLQRLTHRTVYNMGLGGYGPAEYTYLLENKALRLHPSSIIVGFYYGNDLSDAFNMIYKKQYWKLLRNSGFAPLTDDTASRLTPDDSVFLGSLRNCLAHNSVFYRSAMLSFGESLRFIEMKYIAHDEVTILEDTQRGVRTGFTPAAELTSLNLEDPTLTEGLRITLELFQRMKSFCDNKHLRFTVVLLPTKESVFSQYIVRNRIILTNQTLFNRVIDSENKVRDLMTHDFDTHGIYYIDVLDALRAAIGSTDIYPNNADGHPNKHGYEIIAAAILRHGSTSADSSHQPHNPSVLFR